MIPLKDENPITTFPIFVIGIILLNFFVFIYELSLGSGLEKFIFLFGAIPQKIIHLENPVNLVVLFTSLFVHADFFHLLGNMLFLWVFGNNIEDRLGHWGFLLFYFSCGILSTLAYSLTQSNSHLPLIGASGAISGILGAYFLLYPTARVLVLIPILFFWRIVKIPAFWFLLIWIAFQFLFGAASFTSSLGSDGGGVAWLAHIFGFICGAFLLTLFLRAREV